MPVTLGQDAVLPAELSEALERGPFHRALTLAVQASGLSLQRLQQRLADNGVSVSITTLSYWKHGRSQPERAGSLQGVRVLEKLLRLPPESLTGLLGQPRPRGRWINAEPPPTRVGEFFDNSEAAERLMAELGVPDVQQVKLLTSHDRVRVNADRTLSGHSSRLVVQATVDRVSRNYFLHSGDPQGRLVSMVDTRHCRIGRVRTNAAAGYVAIEIVFDRVLGRGDTTIYEYFLETGTRDDYFDRIFRHDTMQYLLEVEFSPEAVPARCLSFRRPKPSDERTDLREVWISPELVAHVAFTDLSAGIYGMCWEWT
ncbi:hypothetical protein [Fodinicola feengrottensis]